MNKFRISFLVIVFLFLLVLISPQGLFRKLEVLAQTTAPWTIEKDTADSEKLKFYKSDKTNSAITLDTANKVGIGTANPAGKLHINAGIISPALRVETDNNGPWGLILKNKTAPGAGLQIFQANNGDIQFWNDYSGSQALKAMITITKGGGIGIGNPFPGADKLDVGGRAYASGGWQTTDADYAEWFEKEGEAKAGDVIGIDLITGKARKYQPGDKFVGIYSANPAMVGNRVKETDEEMSKDHALVGLLGQLDVDWSQVKTEGRLVRTIDGFEIGILLSNGKVLIGR